MHPLCAVVHELHLGQTSQVSCTVMIASAVLHHHNAPTAATTLDGQHMLGGTSRYKSGTDIPCAQSRTVMLASPPRLNRMTISLFRGFRIRRHFARFCYDHGHHCRVASRLLRRIWLHLGWAPVADFIRPCYANLYLRSSPASLSIADSHFGLPSRSNSGSSIAWGCTSGTEALTRLENDQSISKRLA